MRTILLALLITTASNIYAQRVCISSNAQSAAQNSTAITEVLSGITGPSDNSTPSGVIRIPVVVHVLYETEAQNISEAQIRSGIDALNRDFRRRNADSTNTPARFKALAADIEIEFSLATSDPRGVATNGIVRKATSVKAWTIDDKIKSSKWGGADGWDPAQYLNIWIGNMPRTLGYSSIPGDATAVDGVVIHNAAFGTLGKSGAYNMGRTLVHEVGHWFGLKHIWGDADCGDDGIDDTPKQGGFTSGCPNKFLSSCNNGALGDMYMNYMDFTNDACMNLFTQGQKAKMRAQFAKGGSRRSILSSKGLNAPTIQEAPVVNTPVHNNTPVTNPASPETRVEVSKATLYPNPAPEWIQVTLPDASWIGKELHVIGFNGVVTKRVIITSVQQKIILQGLPSGLYLVQGRNSGARITEKFIKTASGQ